MNWFFFKFFVYIHFMYRGTVWCVVLSQLFSKKDRLNNFESYENIRIIGNCVPCRSLRRKYLYYIPKRLIDVQLTFLGKHMWLFSGMCEFRYIAKYPLYSGNSGYFWDLWKSNEKIFWGKNWEGGGGLKY